MAKAAVQAKNDSSTESKPDKDPKVLEVNVAPKGFFALPKHKVDSILPFDDYIMATSTIDGRNSFDFFTQAGKRINLDTASLARNVSSHSIAQCARSIKNVKKLQLDVRATSSKDSVNIADVMDRLKIDLAARDSFVQGLSQALNARLSKAGNLDSIVDGAVELTHLDKEFTFNYAPSFSYFAKQGLLAASLGERGVLAYKLRSTSSKRKVLDPQHWQLVNDAKTEFKKLRVENEEYTIPVKERTQLLSNSLEVSLKGSVLKITNKRNGKLLYTDGARAISACADRIVYIGADGKEVKTVTLVGGVKNVRLVRSLKLNDGNELTNIATSRNGDALVLSTRNETQEAIRICTTESIEPLASIRIGTSKFCLDANQNIVFVDSENRLRIAQTNLAEFDSGELTALRLQNERELSQLIEHLDTLEFSEKGRTVRQATIDGDSQELQKLKVKAERKLRQRLDPLIEGAKTVDQFNNVLECLAELKSQEPLARMTDVIEAVESQVAAKLEPVLVNQLEEGIDSICQRLDRCNDAVDLLDLEWKVLDLTKERMSIAIRDSESRTSVSRNFAILHEKLESRRSEISSKIEEEICKRYADLEKVIGQAASPWELEIIQRDPKALAFHTLLACIVDPDEITKWREQYRNLVRQRRYEVEKDSADMERRIYTRVAIATDEFRKTMEEIRERTGEIGKINELKIFRLSDPLMLQAEAKLAAVPENNRRKLEIELNEIFEKRSGQLVSRAGLQLATDGDKVKFNKVEFEIAPTIKLRWYPVIKPQFEGATEGKLVYESSVGLKYVPDIAPLPIELSNERTKIGIEKTNEQAREFFEQRNRQIPQWNTNWIVNAPILKNLEEFSESAQIQLTEQSGIIIVESEAGTGKDVELEIWCHLTNRELITIPCNSKSEVEDLTMEPFIDPVNGSGYRDSKLVESITRPYAVIAFDEPNTWPEGVAHLTNSLFDGRRRLVLKDGRVIPVHPTVIFVGHVNPQYYLGVKAIPEVTKDRATILSRDYPPFNDAAENKYFPYEAEMLARKITCLREMPQEDFYKLWDFSVNNERANGGELLVNPARANAIQGIFSILQIANTLREDYRNFRSTNSSSLVTHPFSLRSSISSASWFERLDDVHEAVKKVFIPKLHDLQSREAVSRLIDKI